VDTACAEELVQCKGREDENCDRDEESEGARYDA